VNNGGGFGWANDARISITWSDYPYLTDEDFDCVQIFVKAVENIDPI
jgi:hypothetical protein